MNVRGGRTLSRRRAKGRSEASKVLALAALLVGCTGTIDPVLGPGRGASGELPAGDVGSGGARDPDAYPDTGHIPAHVRKLTNAEYDATVRDLLGLSVSPAAAFATDDRNGYYTPNLLQRVDETRGDQLAAAAAALAKQVVTERLEPLVGCSPSAGMRCAQSFIASFAPRAFRRPVSADERAGLEAVFALASDGGTFADGVEAVVSAVLQSPSFLYISQLGGSGEGVRTLESYEIASALSYFVYGGPPDSALTAAAEQGALAEGSQRAAHFDRLIAGDPRAKERVRRFLKEWLAVDELWKASPVVPGVSYEAVRPLLEAETDAFIDRVLFEEDGSLQTLLGADFTMVNAALASYYGLPAPAGSGFVRTDLSRTERRGLLTQGSFLVAHASRDHSSPVKRGVTVLRRLLCKTINFPSGDLAQVAMRIPEAKPTETTRERFLAHATDVRCSGCHALIDPLGFAFERFDQAGRFRTQENGRTVDASGMLGGTDVDAPFDGAADLVSLLAQSEDVSACFAKNLARFSATVAAKAFEARFLQLWQALPASDRGSVLKIMRAFVASEAFVTRSPT